MSGQVQMAVTCFIKACAIVAVGDMLAQLEIGKGKSSTLIASILDKAFKGESRKDLTGFHNTLISSHLCPRMGYG